MDNVDKAENIGTGPVGDLLTDVGIQGNLFIANGNGGSTTDISDSLVGGLLVPGVAGYGLPRFWGTFGGIVTVLNGDGHDHFTLDNGNYDGGILTDLFIVNGDGGSSTRLLDSTVGHLVVPRNILPGATAASPVSGPRGVPDCGVIVLNGAGKDCFTLDNTDAGDGVFGLVFIANGDGGSRTRLTNTQVDGNLTVLNGEGFDCFRQTNTPPPVGPAEGVGQVVDGGVMGDVFIADSGGGSSTTFTETAVLGSATVLTGDGTDRLTVDTYANGGNLFVSTGAGSDTVKMDNFGINGSSTIFTDADNDTVNIETEHEEPVPGADSLAEPLGDLTEGTFTGGLYLNTGAGDDSVTIGGSEDDTVANFGSASILDGGLDTDTLDLAHAVFAPGTLDILNFENLV